MKISRSKMTEMERYIKRLNPGQDPMAIFGEGYMMSNILKGLIFDKRGRSNYLDYRRKVIDRFGFAILDRKTIERLRPYAPFVEVGAGSGYWTYELRRFGVDCIATEPNPRRNKYGFEKVWCRRRHMDGIEAVTAFPDRTPLVVWPCYNDPWAERMLKKVKAKVFVYVGEGYGGCTGDDGFHNLLSKKWESIETITIPKWQCIHDDVTVYRRKKA